MQSDQYELLYLPLKGEDQVCYIKRDLQFNSRSVHGQQLLTQAFVRDNWTKEVGLIKHNDLCGLPVAASEDALELKLNNTSELL